MSKLTNLNLNEKFYIFDNFITSNRYILERGDDEWDSSKIFFQLSIEHGDNSPLTHGAEEFEEDGKVDWDYIKDINRRDEYIINPLVDMIKTDENIENLEVIEDKLFVYTQNSTLVYNKENFQKINFFDTTTKKLEKTKRELEGVESHKYYIPLKNGDLFCYGGLVDRDVIIRDGKTLEQKTIIKGHGGSPVYLQELLNGDIATISYQRAFRILRDYKEIYKLDTMYDVDILGFYFDESKNTLIAYAKDNIVKKFEINLNQNTLEQSNLINGRINTQFDDYILMSAIHINKIDKKTYKIIDTNVEYESPIGFITKLNYKYFASASTDRTIKIFDIDSFKSIKTLEFKDTLPMIDSMQINEDEVLIYNNYGGNTSYVFNLKNLGVRSVNKKDYDTKSFKQHNIKSTTTYNYDNFNTKWFSTTLYKEELYIDNDTNVVCIKDGKKSIKFLKLIPSYYLVLDLESTCANDNSIKDDDREIIEIGAVMIEKNSGKVVDQFQSFIKPTVHKNLTSFCTSLTNITQDDVDTAKSFSKVMEEFEKWFSIYKNFTFTSWGSYDEWQFQLDCKRSQYKYPFVNHLNVRELYSQHINSDDKYTIPDALKYFDLEFGGTYHRGIDDAKNIVKILNKIKV